MYIYIYIVIILNPKISKVTIWWLFRCESQARRWGLNSPMGIRGDFPIFPSEKLMFLKGESGNPNKNLIFSCRMEWNPFFHISIYSGLTSEMEWNGIYFHFWFFLFGFPIRSSDSTFDAAARPGQPLASPAPKRWCWSSYGSFASPVPKILSWPETGRRYSLVGGLEHEFYFSIQLGMSSSQLTNIFQRGSNHQPVTSLAIVRSISGYPLVN